MGDAGEITASEIHPHRAELMETARKRLGLTSITTIVRDGRAAAGQYDAVLLDAPCTGLGTLRRRPDIKYRYSGIDPALLDTQRALLKSAAASVKPGGVLVYATCTVLHEENADMMRWFINNHSDYVLESEKQLVPGVLNDGFYIARLRRNQEEENHAC
jgi:16S rRNA (cytosine967-C5)-methyltransferase